MILEFPTPDPRSPTPAAGRPLPWYALRVKALHEFHVERELCRYGIEPYLPTRKRKHWRNTEVDVPLIPGYVFARAEACDIYATLRWTNWLTNILGDRHGPTEIPADQIETLRLMVANSKIEVIPLADIWKGGEEVEVVSGPLQGAKGRVARVKNKTQLVIFIEMLGSAICTELDAASVRVIPVDLPLAA